MAENLSKKKQSRMINFIDQLNLVVMRNHYTPRENWIIWPKKIESLFDSAKWVTGEYLSQFDSQCWVSLTLNVVSIWLLKLGQFDSQCWVNLTLNIESIWISMLRQFDSQWWVNWTLNVESNWLSILSQFDSQCWVGLTLNVGPIWLPMLSQFDSQCSVNLTQIFSSYPLCRSNFPGQNDSFFLSVYIIACRHDYSEVDDATPQAIINQDFSFSI